MPNLNYTWTDEQVAEVNGRAIIIFDLLATKYDLPPELSTVVYQGILNMCGQVEIAQITPGRLLPGIDQLRG